MSKLKIQITYTGSYKRTSVEEVINPVTEVITKLNKVTKKFLYEAAFLSQEDKDAYVSANATDTYTPLQEDGSVRVTSNVKFDGIQGEGSTAILEAVLTKSGQYVIPTTSDEDVELQFLKDKALANATDPAHKAALAKAIAEAEQTEIIDMTAVLAQRKQARLAAQNKESASLEFGSFADAKASSKKLDVK
jgi:hypothetical protein